MKIVVVSGGFDPLHSGHIAYFKSAREYGDKLIVALNSDDWLINKKKKFFLPFEERKIILENLSMIDEVVAFDDDDKGSCIHALVSIKQKYQNDEIIFCNGGDRTNKNIPEMALEGIKFEFGVGGIKKKNSSSWILKDWKFEKETRRWGHFYNLFDTAEVKVKELIVKPGKGMSFQKHVKRNEIWLVSEGSCLVNHSHSSAENKKEIALKKFDHFVVRLGEWHQIINPNQEECRIIEIQYGDKVVESDIERLYYYN